MITETADPEVAAQVRDSFLRYNAAIETGDVEALNGFFWQSPLTVRFGNAEHLFGYDEISTYRTGVWKAGPPRTLERLAVTALGSDVAVTNAMFRNANGSITRQTQTWARVEAGWRIASAHVSLVPA